MKLYLVHCGFYDPDIGDGIYEIHTNFFAVAGSFEAARDHVKTLTQYKQKKMHVDGVQEIEAVNGYRLSFTKDKALEGRDLVLNYKYRSNNAPTPSKTPN